MPSALALLAGVSPRVVAVADVPSPGGGVGFPAGAAGRSRRVGGGPGTLSLQLPLLHNFMLRCRNQKRRAPAAKTRRKTKPTRTDINVIRDLAGVSTSTSSRANLNLKENTRRHEKNNNKTGADEDFNSQPLPGRWSVVCGSAGESAPSKHLLKHTT